MRRGYVFFVQAEGGKIKIGHSISPICQLRMYQTGSPEKLTLVARIRGSKEMKDRLLRLFSPYRSHGEWFNSCPGIEQLIEQHPFIYPKP